MSNEKIDALQERKNEIRGQLRTLRQKLKGAPRVRTFAQEAAKARAVGDDDKATALLDRERNAEAEIDHLRRSLKELDDMLADAKNEYANEQLPEQAAVVNDKVDAFVEVADELVEAGRELREAVAAYRQLAQDSKDYKQEYGRVHPYPVDLSVPEGIAAHLYNAIATR